MEIWKSQEGKKNRKTGGQQAGIGRNGANLTMKVSMKVKKERHEHRGRLGDTYIREESEGQITEEWEEEEERGRRSHLPFPRVNNCSDDVGGGREGERDVTREA
ncbi:hypothetical protein Q8A67_022971 [Cirrhinus molitorella]|uniref:Uncharacterized protein n=1 Tax=Cirrhinus molitorella TaxID=172907 RepID=A0AA88PAL3_9TELE|nr:hypothetical protein Q8A67_022971 [Cirrhinus molitorella]